MAETELSDLGAVPVAQPGTSGNGRSLTQSYDPAELGAVPVKAEDLSDLGAVSVEPPKSYEATKEGIQFSQERPADGLRQALKAGLVSKEYAEKNLEKFQELQDRHWELVNRAGGESEAKALIHGMGKGAAFLAASIPGAKAGATIGTMAAGGPESPLAPIGAVAGGAIGGLATGALGQAGYKKLVDLAGDYSELVKSAQASAELHPVYDAAGSLVAFGTQAPRSIKNIAEAAKLAGGGKISAPAVAKIVGAGAAGGALFEGALRPAFDIGVNAASDALGIAHEDFQKPTLSSMAVQMGLGALLAGHNLAFRDYGTPEITQLIMKGHAREQAGIGPTKDGEGVRARLVEAYRKLGASSPPEALEASGLLDPLTPEEFNMYATLKEGVEQWRQSGQKEQEKITGVTGRQVGIPGISGRRTPFSSLTFRTTPRGREAMGRPAITEGEGDADQIESAVPQVSGGAEVERAAEPVATGSAGEVQPAAGAAAPQVREQPVAAGTKGTEGTEAPSTAPAGAELEVKAPVLPPKHIGVMIQRADGSTYYAAFGGYWEQLPGVPPVISRQLPDGTWSTGSLEAGEQVVSKVPPAPKQREMKKAEQEGTEGGPAKAGTPSEPRASKFDDNPLYVMIRDKVLGAPGVLQALHNAPEKANAIITSEFMKAVNDTFQNIITRTGKPGAPIDLSESKLFDAINQHHGEVVAAIHRHGLDEVAGLKAKVMGPAKDATPEEVVEALYQRLASAAQDIKGGLNHATGTWFEIQSYPATGEAEIFARGYTVKAKVSDLLAGKRVFTVVTGKGTPAYEPAQPAKAGTPGGEWTEGTEAPAQQKATKETKEAELRAIIEGEGDAGAKARQLAGFAKKHGVTLKQAQELTELEIVRMAHDLALTGGEVSGVPRAVMADLVKLYKRQPLLSARTSTSVENQAYSTPAPLSYALGYAVGVNPNTAVYDGTAGNGMMLIGADLAKSQGNEIDPGRVHNLRQLGVGVVTQKDAESYVPLGKFPVVKLNPPFGTIPNQPYDGYKITKLEHLIALRGLEAMADDGKAAIVMGAKLMPPKPGEPVGKDAQWIFENYLYSHYRVAGNFELEGELYNKQGASWPVRVLIVDGRLPVPVQPPITGMGPKTVERLATWEQVWGRLAGIRYAIEQRRQAMGAGGATGVSGGAAGATTTTEGQGDAAELPRGTNKPAGGGGGRGGKGSGGTKADGPVAGGQPGVSSGESVSRPEDGIVPAEQPGDPGGTAPRVEGGHGGSAGVAGHAGGGGEAGSGGVKPGRVPGPAAIEDELANISDDDLQKMLEEGAAEAQKAPQKETKETKPAKAGANKKAKRLLPQAAGWTRADIEHLLKLVEDGKMVLVGDANLGIPTIHDFKNAEHKGYGMFVAKGKTKGQEWEVAFDAGGTMQRTPSDKGYTTLGLRSGSYPYDFEGVKATLQGYLTAPATAKKAAGEAKGGIEDVWKGLGELFGGGQDLPSSLGLPPFNEKTWAKAKPLLESGWEQFKRAGKTLKDFISEAFRRFGQAIKPYLDRFLQGLRNGLKRPPTEDHIAKQPPTVAGNELQAVYRPHSKAPAFGTLVPGSIAERMWQALELVEAKRGPVDDYVADKLNFNVEHLFKVMAAEQVDGTALMFHQQEEAGAVIIGDETGIGKGRQGAAFLWAGKVAGKVPVFITQDPKLFSDMYGDLKDLVGGRPPINPFILGSPEKASIKEIVTGDDGAPETAVIFRSPTLERQRSEIGRIRRDGWEASGYDMIFLTYSQVNAQNMRQQFLELMAQKYPVYLVMDESHNAAGDATSSMQAAFFGGGVVKRKEPGGHTIQVPVQGILNLPGTKLEGGGGVVYMSATWAKRPENTPVYFRTSLSQAAQNPQQIVGAMKAGGVALQQYVSEVLAGSGQYVRRERDFSGVDYQTKKVQVANPEKLVDEVDQVTDVLSEIIRFSHAFVAAVKRAAAGKKGTGLTQTQMDVTEFASIVHNQVGQLLLAAKAEAVIAEALAMHAMGEKPVIALMNTMEAFLDHYVEDHGIKPGTVVKIRWNELLKHALRRTLRVTQTLPDGTQQIEFADPEDFGMAEQYRAVEALADGVESKFPISPIDYILQKLRAKGLKMAELTGRTTGIEYTDFENGEGLYRHFRRADKNDVVNGFNNGGHDGMLLNASGSTGLSAHSKVGFLDLRARALIVAQPALDISTFVQTLGRIRRTGMVLNGIKRLIKLVTGGESVEKYPELAEALRASNGLRSYVKLPESEERYGARYIHLVLPLQAELRPAAVCAKKMKSLNANSTAESEGAVKVETEDIMNRYGEQVVAEYLDANHEVQAMTGLYVGTNTDGTLDYTQDLAMKFTRRMQTLPDAMQKQAYDYILPAYRELIQQLKATGEYDLEIVVHKDWDGVMQSDDLLSQGTNEENGFTASVRLQKWEVKDQRHVPTGEEMAREFANRSGSKGKVAEGWAQYQAKVAAELDRRAAELQRMEEEAAQLPEKSSEKALATMRVAAERVTLQQARGRWDQSLGVMERVVPLAGEVADLANTESGESFDGMLVEIRWPAVVKFAPGAFRMRFALHAPGGVAFLNGTRFTTGQWTISESDKSLSEIGPGRGDQRYVRFFVTGNPIKGYEITGGRGKIVRFNSREGQTITGLQMPKNWSPAQLTSNPQLELASGKAARHFLSIYGGRSTPLDIGGYVRAQPAGGGNVWYDIQTTGSKQGKVIYLDGPLRKITGDFVKRGSRWIARVEHDDLAKALDRVMAITGRRFAPVGDAGRLMPQVAASNKAGLGQAQGSLATNPPSELMGRPQIDADDLQQLRSVINDPSVGLPPRAAALMNAFLDSPAAEKLPKLRVRIVDSLGTYQGSYFQGLIQLARGADPWTGVHEMLHALFEVLPDELQAEIERMRVATIDAMIADIRTKPEAAPSWESVGTSTGTTEERIAALESLKAEPTRGSLDFYNRGFSGAAYAVSSPTEFLAHVASARFEKRVGSMVKGFWETLKEMIRSFFEAVKRGLGKLRPKQQDAIDRVLSGDFEPVEARNLPEAGSLAPGEERRRVATEVYGEPYYVYDREEITPSSIEASALLAKKLLEEADIPAARMESDPEGPYANRRAWLMQASGPDMTGQGRKLLEILKRELQSRPAGKAGQELANLIASIRLNFEMKHSALHRMAPEVREELWAMAQTEPSQVGLALQAHAGYAHDAVFVGRNMDVELGKWWADTLSKEIGMDGDTMRRLLDEVAAAREEGKGTEGTTGTEGTGEPTEADALRQRMAGLEKERDYLANALDRALKQLAPKMVERWGSGSRIGKKMLDLIQSGEAAPWRLFRELMRDRGYKVPTDEEIRMVKNLADRAEGLRTLTDNEAGQAKGNRAEIERLLMEKQRATLDEFIRLKKKIDTQWVRWTQRLNIFKGKTERVNALRAVRDFAQANLLLKIGFPVRLGLDILTQMVLHAPTRPLANAVTLTGGKITVETWGNVSRAYGAALKDYAGAMRTSLGAAVSTLRGTQEADRVGGVMNRIGIFDRALAKAEELDARGQHAQAFVAKLFAFMRHGYTVAKMLHNFQGLPAKRLDLRAYVVSELRANGMNAAEAEVNADEVMGSLNDDIAEAHALAAGWLEGNGIEPTKEAVAVAARRIGYGRAMERMRAMHLPADAFEDRAQILSDTLGWQRPEVGGLGGFLRTIQKATEKMAEQTAAASPYLMPVALALEAVTFFSNATANLVNRAMVFFPILGGGFWPAAFGVGGIDAEGIAHEGSPRFRTAEDRAQQRIFSLLMFIVGPMLIYMVLSRLLTVRTKYPREQAKRALWEKNGWRPGQIDLELGGGKAMRFSMHTGLFVVAAPWLAAAAAVRDLQDERESAQLKLNEEAEKKGLTPGKVRPVSTGDLVGVAGQAALHGLTAGRTTQGLINALTEQGQFNLAKTVSSTLSSYAPTLPAMQELMRASGKSGSINPDMAKVWDYMVPLQASGAARTNVLGDKVGATSSLQRMVEAFTGGNFPIPFNKAEAEQAADGHAYQTLFASGFNVPYIEKNKAYPIDGIFRPFNDVELSRYAQLRGSYLKANLQGLPVDASREEVGEAYREANQAALDDLGVSVVAPRGSGRAGAGKAAAGGGAKAEVGSKPQAGAGSGMSGFGGGGGGGGGFGGSGGSGSRSRGIRGGGLRRGTGGIGGLRARMAMRSLAGLGRGPGGGSLRRPAAGGTVRMRLGGARGLRR